MIYANKYNVKAKKLQAGTSDDEGIAPSSNLDQFKAGLDIGNLDPYKNAINSQSSTGLKSSGRFSKDLTASNGFNTGLGNAKINTSRPLGTLSQTTQFGTGLSNSAASFGKANNKVSVNMGLKGGINPLAGGKAGETAKGGMSSGAQAGLGAGLGIAAGIGNAAVAGGGQQSTAYDEEGILAGINEQTANNRSTANTIGNTAMAVGSAFGPIGMAVGGGVKAVQLGLTALGAFDKKITGAEQNKIGDIKRGKNNERNTLMTKNTYGDLNKASKTFGVYAQKGTKLSLPIETSDRSKVKDYNDSLALFNKYPNTKTHHSPNGYGYSFLSPSNKKVVDNSKIKPIDYLTISESEDIPMYKKPTQPYIYKKEELKRNIEPEINILTPRNIEFTKASYDEQIIKPVKTQNNTVKKATNYIPRKRKQERAEGLGGFNYLFKKGGKGMFRYKHGAVILGGSRHHEKNELGTKGNPIVDAKGVKVAETEREELLLNKEQTDKLEALHAQIKKNPSDISLYKTLGETTIDIIRNQTKDNSGKFKQLNNE